MADKNRTTNGTRTLKDCMADFRFRLAEAPPIAYGIGCAWLGRSPDDRRQVKEDVATLMTAFEQGFRYYDTSRAYGQSEAVVGQFVKEIPRDRIFLASKSRVPYTVHPNEAAKALEENLQISLSRLNTDHLDLYQLHDVDTLSHIWDEGGVLDTLLNFRKTGLVRHIGLATRQHELLEEAARQGSFDSILTYNDYTPINQSAKALIEVAEACRVAVVNGSPLCFGWLSGLDPRERAVGDSPRDKERQMRSVRFYDYCQKREVSTLAAALQFPLRHPGIDITLTGPATSNEVRASAQALGERIPDEFWTDWQEQGFLT
ncbi:aldo/keto reductase [Paenibacillus koleovorans]|uniref:aldo/keto reductase n=1 Tax=Paenibacillus koleovorans TaxID=121608 RepID=UPI000FD90B82|nr:aldo/keto reductase [Paenibacillus koleovorans]